MAKKKRTPIGKKKVIKFRLKTGFKRFLVFLALFICVGIYTYKQVKIIKADYAYKESLEYKLLQVGYSKNEVSTILEKLPQDRIDKLLEEPYNKSYYLILSQKYYLEKNLDKYLEYALYHEEDKMKDIVLPDEEMSDQEKEDYILNEKYKKFISIINVHANEGWYNVTYGANLDSGYLVLVNKFYHLPDNYQRDDIKNIGLDCAYSGQRASTIVIEKYLEMRKDVLNELGVHLMVNSSFRPYSEQEELYNERKTLWGQRKADMYAARPGHSEHQTALAIDITSLEHPYDEQFMDSDEYKWLIDNCYKYGFILRYPKGKEDITGYSNESWHFRYVGYDAAKVIHDDGITLDEYYAYYIEK